MILESNGKGEELYYNGNLQFKGEYLNGKRWNGFGYNCYGIPIFTIKDGKGKIKNMILMAIVYLMEKY